MVISNNPKIWGPVLWRKLHTLSFQYPMKIDENDPTDAKIQDTVRKLFMELRNSIPCKTCRDSYRMFLKQMPIEPHLGGREALSKWLYRLHNKVNAKLRNLERAKYTQSIMQLEEEARLRRMSSDQFNKMKQLLKQSILITGPDPTFEYVKNQYRFIGT